ncbi:hypothetical protein PHLCEN_2v6232 [Hermanssonia centrifuga]|uniref:Glycosyltransferase 61 catalytic domain-containing protein n=1 Tax=Hermanssonia centrifuga TaxID=98765 RepID=A0A2R6P0N3_9APHY|nr:hypothetical protein PHLCEN_2v6232 [Hermanssonia centrifuga]
MHIASSFFGIFQPELYSGDITVNTQVIQQPQQPLGLPKSDVPHPVVLNTPKPPPITDLSVDFPETTIDAHAPGWTLFHNLYMSNGTLYVVSSHPYSDFPDINLMTSTGLAAENTPENIAARMPTSQELDFITPEEARTRWGPIPSQPRSKNRVWNVQGNTLLSNDPSQFLDHYYHFCAELMLGAWAFWQGAHGAKVDPKRAELTTAPPFTRAIFAHADADGWRDRPGFNSYFLRASFPSLTVEVQADWQDRVAATSAVGDYARTWHFDSVLLSDRSAAFRGVICGTQVHRTAGEAFHFMRNNGNLTRWWWEPVRRAVLRFASVDQRVLEVGVRAQIESEKAKIDGLAGSRSQRQDVVVTYIDRQGVRRHLIDEDHERLVAALHQMCAIKGWELNIVQAEKLTKEQQLNLAARTTVLLGVHGNGLTHLIMMSPTPISTVIEMFFPGGFAHDYEWTARALGHKHFAVWNDTYHTYPNLPHVDYPEGFQGTEIPVHAENVINIIESRVAGSLS